MTILKTPYKRNKHDHEDRISQLPEPILHNILSFLPTKDTTKTSALSKTWGSVVKSFPILDFNQNDFDGGKKSKSFEEVVRDFTKHVNGTIDRRDSCTDTLFSIQKFSLAVNLKQTCLKSRRKGDFERWLNYAVSNNVEHLVFRHIVERPPSKRRSTCSKKQWPYNLRASSPLFRADNKSLKELELYGCKFSHKKAIERIRFSLKILKLEEVDIDDQTIRSLLSHCSGSLEELSIRNCHVFDSVSISSTKLKSVDLVLSRFQVQKIAIEAPNLRFLSYGGGEQNVQASLEASNFDKNIIKELRLFAVTISEAMVRFIVREFHVLEKLDLGGCSLDPKLQSSSYNQLMAHCRNCYDKRRHIGIPSGL